MRIVAIDASALGGGSVSAAVESAATAAERANSLVHRFRLYSMPGKHDTEEAALAVSRGFEGTIAPMVDAILDSDGVILGTPSTHAGLNAGTTALLKRLAACFAGHCLERGYHGRPTRLTPGRRVGLLTSSPSPTALASSHAAALGPTLRVRRTFGRAGIKILRHVSIMDRPGYPLARDRAMARATDLGRELAECIMDEVGIVPVAFERPLQSTLVEHGRVLR